MKSIRIISLTEKFKRNHYKITRRVYTHLCCLFSFLIARNGMAPAAGFRFDTLLRFEVEF